MDATDSVILTRLRVGDPAALDNIARRYRARVYAAALRRVRDPHVADDVTQTVFLRLVERAPRLPDSVKLGGWLITATAYCASETLRAARRRSFHERRAAERGATTYDPSDEVLAAEARDGVRAALRQLGPADRGALGLRYHEGSSVSHVGECLGISTEAAAKRVGRALQRLRGAVDSGGAVGVGLRAAERG